MLGKKLWMFVCLVLFVAGCHGSGAPKSPRGGPTGDEAEAPTQAHASSPDPSTDSEPPARFDAPSSAGGGGAPAEAPALAPPPASRDGERSSDSAAPRSAAPSKQSSAGLSGRSSAADRAEAPAPRTRPGLGTEFGESRESRVHDVSFVRDSARPFAMVSLNYDDRRGVDALVSMAERRRLHAIPAASGAVTISIRDANGEPLEAMHVGDRTFVVGQAGQRYSIVLQNHTSHRFEAVGTVDGLDVINGKPGTPDNRGYVLMPFATLEIDGFRTSSNAVAAFRFAAVADSYAARKGNARNVGVIGLALFTERGDAFVAEREARLRDTANPFPADTRFAPPPPRR